MPWNSSLSDDHHYYYCDVLTCWLHLWFWSSWGSCWNDISSYKEHLAAALDFMSHLWAALCSEMCMVDLVVSTETCFCSRSWMQISHWHYWQPGQGLKLALGSGMRSDGSGCNAVCMLPCGLSLWVLRCFTTTSLGCSVSTGTYWPLWLHLRLKKLNKCLFRQFLMNVIKI